MNRRRFLAISSGLLVVAAIALIWRSTPYNTRPSPNTQPPDTRPSGDTILDAITVEEATQELRQSDPHLIFVPYDQFHDAPITLPLEYGLDVTLPLSDPPPEERFYHDAPIKMPGELELPKLPNLPFP